MTFGSVDRGSLRKYAVESSGALAVTGLHRAGPRCRDVSDDIGVRRTGIRRARLVWLAIAKANARRDRCSPGETLPARRCSSLRVRDSLGQRGAWR